MKFKSLVLSLCFFLFATQADAAWILWERQWQNGKQYDWEPIGGYETRKDCVYVVDQNISCDPFPKENCWNVGRDSKTITAPIHKEEGKMTIVYEYRCLPDTIDPREKK